MTATALHDHDAATVSERPEIEPALRVVPAAEPDPLVAQRGAERTVARSAAVGAAVGALVCAAIWLGLVVIALAGSGSDLAPMLAVGAGCGVFAGIFLGGWAGTLIGAAALEHVEHEQRAKR